MKLIFICNRFKEYDTIVFHEWLKLGIIEEIMGTKSGHYLPHPPVLKNKATQPRLRPDFDASAKDRNGNFINACFYKSSNFIQLISLLIIKFRKEAIGVCMDVEKAVLQMFLTPNDRDPLKFIWLEDY